MENNLEQAKNMKLLLSAFEQLSGLNINFHKNEILCYGVTPRVSKPHDYANHMFMRL
jgi:hypothetical protein